MSETAFSIDHQAFLELLLRGALASRSPRSIESAIAEGIKLVRLVVQDGAIGVSSVAPDVLSLAYTKAQTTIGTAHAVCVNAEDLVRDIESIIKPHTVRVSWDIHGQGPTPSGKVSVVCTNAKGKAALQWEHDAYDPTHVMSARLPTKGLVVFAAEEIKRAIDAIGFAANAASSDGLLDSVLLRVVEGKAQLAATDRNQLAVIEPATVSVGQPEQEFVLLNAVLLSKIAGLFAPSAEVTVAEDADTEHIWIKGEGLAVRLTMPAAVVRASWPLFIVDKFSGVATPTTAVVDRGDLVQAMKAAQARESRYCQLQVSDAATEIAASYHHSAKPVLISCDPVTGTLQSQISLSSLGLLKAANQIRGEKVQLGFDASEKRAILHDPTDPRTFYVFQRSEAVN